MWNRLVALQAKNLRYAKKYSALQNHMINVLIFNDLFLSLV